MLNKRKYFTHDPMRIAKYNDFLKTIDKNCFFPNKNETKLDEIKRTMSNDEDFKKELDKLIDRISENFYINDMRSANFNGQTQYDNLNFDTHDPNKYLDFLNKSYNIKYYKYIPKNYTETNNSNNNSNNNLNNKSNEEKSEIVIKETINIETEINNITDILKLVDTYKNDPEIKYNINMKSLHDIKEPLEELNNMIGMVQLKNNIVDQILYFIQNLHKSDKSSGEFLHTVIYGPPGTGKTEIAKIMGKIYSKLGILSKGTFKKVTRSDLIAGYLGQTALKTKDVIKESIGGVLFIDEAYSLGNPEKRDSFAKECIDFLCESLSNDKNDLMVIIVGYEKELKESFFAFNQGLDSRFTWRFKTDDYSHEDLYKIFLKMVKDIGWEIDEKSNINSDWFKKNKEYFRFFGRDIESLLSKTKIAHSRRVFCKPENEKKKINVTDLNKGLEIYLKNDDIKAKKEEEDRKKYLYSTLYS